MDAGRRVSPEDRRLIMHRIVLATRQTVRECYASKLDDTFKFDEQDIAPYVCSQLDLILRKIAVDQHHLQIELNSYSTSKVASPEIIAADLFVSVTVKELDGSGRGFFVRTKHYDNVSVSCLQEVCKRMHHLYGCRCGYVWVFGPCGIDVYSTGQIIRAAQENNALECLSKRSLGGFMSLVLAGNAGSRTWSAVKDTREMQAILDRVSSLGINNVLEIQISLEGDLMKPWLRRQPNQS